MGRFGAFSTARSQTSAGISYYKFFVSAGCHGEQVKEPYVVLSRGYEAVLLDSMHILMILKFWRHLGDVV